MECVNDLFIERRIIPRLEQIVEFGQSNPGCGYTCAKMAQTMLDEIERTQPEKEPKDYMCSCGREIGHHELCECKKEPCEHEPDPHSMHSNVFCRKCFATLPDSSVKEGREDESKH